MSFFFLFSCIGLLWVDSYYSIISDNGWFMAYSMFFGWWLSIFPAREYYIANENYFNTVF
jgi:hypothetical protein